jgi:hypothetical protein
MNAEEELTLACRRVYAKYGPDLAAFFRDVQREVNEHYRIGKHSSPATDEGQEDADGIAGAKKEALGHQSKSGSGV